jgi:hypothetical protein
MIIRRSTQSAGWWLFGAGLAFAAWWGLPLIQTDRFENQFYGLFWYSMIALGVVVWALPVEQRAYADRLERRYAVFGLIALWQKQWPVSGFKEVHIEREAGLLFGESFWVIVTGEGDLRHAFAQCRRIEAAGALAQELATLTGLPLAASADEA